MGLPKLADSGCPPEQPLAHLGQLQGGAGLGCFTSGSYSYYSGSRKCEFRQREKGRVTAEPELSRSARPRGVLAARRSCLSHVGPTLLTGVVLFPKTGYYWWAFRRLRDSPGRPGFPLPLGRGPFLPPAYRVPAKEARCRRRVTLVASGSFRLSLSAAAAESDHTPASWMTLCSETFSVHQS